MNVVSSIAEGMVVIGLGFLALGALGVLLILTAPRGPEDN